MDSEPSEGSGQEAAAEAAMRQRKAEVAAARRAAILAQMSAQQKSFIKEHAQLFQETGNFDLLGQIIWDLFFYYFNFNFIPGGSFKFSLS